MGLMEEDEDGIDDEKDECVKGEMSFVNQPSAPGLTLSFQISVV